MKLEELMEEWSKDSKIDKTEAGEALLNIPVLHSKYLNILTQHKLVAKKIQQDINEKIRIKYEYFRGDLNNPEDLEKHGLPPFSKKVLPANIPMYIDADEEINKLYMKKAVQDEIVSYCTSVLKEINNRSFSLRAYVDWIRFTKGS